MNKENITNELIDVMNIEFTEFLARSYKKRDELINANNLLQSEYYFSKKKIRVKNNTSLKLNPSEFIPNGNYVYPLPFNEKFRPKKSFKFDYMPVVSTFHKFQEFLESVKPFVIEWNLKYPHNLEDRETVDNKFFIIWIFVKLVRRLKKVNCDLNFLCRILAGMIDKDSEVIYDIIFNFIKNRKRAKHSLCKLTNLRKYFCNICDRYSCSIHFYYDKDDETDQTFINKSSLNLKFKNINQEENQTYCNNNLDCYIKNNSNDIDGLFESVSNQDINIIISLIKSSKTFSPCFIFSHKILSKPYPCYRIKLISDLISAEELRSIGLNLKELTLVKTKNNIKPKKQIKPIYSSKRFDYNPCSHAETCNENCECIKRRGRCEIYCNCSSYCEYLYTDCSQSCAKNINLSSCLCNKSDRECGYKCPPNHNKITRKIKIALSKSLICDGYGAFALEDISKDEILCEYDGEIIDRMEADNRSILVEFFDWNYLFTITKSIDIDAFRVGNLMRYVNHGNFGYDNCATHGRFVDGMWKIILYAKRNISKGEELFFDYQFTQQKPWLMKYNYLYRK